MAKSHAFIADLELWISELDSRSAVSVLEAASREYQFSLLALALGQYRAAFSALRLTLELSFAAVQWSTNERELREWTNGLRDCNWSALIDKENGVLSTNFVRLFADGLEPEAAQYRGAAAAAFRECSEYVHGNAAANRHLPQQIAFEESIFDAWHTKASAVRLVISFGLAVRFLLDLEQPARARLESMIMDHLGHSAGLRAILGAPVETING
jgi:hypothetical protein